LVLLQTIPGIDAMGAAMLLVEIGTDMESFGSAQRLASWVGICPGNNESASKRRAGEPARAMPGCAVCYVNSLKPPGRSRCALKDKFAALSIRKGHKKSIVALAHKILRIIYSMFYNKSHYQDRSVDTRLCSSSATLRAGSKCSPSTATCRNRVTLPTFPFALASASRQGNARLASGFFHVKAGLFTMVEARLQPSQSR
jgi:hypothetical protein